jgi:hypothetical protein
MKKTFLLMIMLVAFGIATTNAQSTITVKDSLTSDQHWTSDNFYLLQGFVYVLDGATLTIDSGTVIKGDHTFTGSALIIRQGAKIYANGTKNKPIVFTSDQPAGSRVRGDWGGVILCGKAPINPTGGTAMIEGGPYAPYGGTDAADNSGILRYVRIEWAGYPFQPNKEINGLTFGGVGSGTTVEHVQVSYSNDDSFEWFGGTVNAKYLIAYRGLDDEFDTDFGWSGMNQFLVGLRDSAVADISGSNGFESDNDATGSDNSPFTHGIMCNASLFGPKAIMTNPVNPLFKRAMHIRRNSKLCVYNSIFVGWPIGLMIDGKTTTWVNAQNNELQIENCIMSGMTSSKFFAVGSGGWTDAADSIAGIANVRTWYKTTASNNDTLATNDLMGITDPFNYINPDFLPLGSSPVLGHGSFTNTRLQDAFFTPVTYAGAFGTEDWTNGWANWDPQNTVYTTTSSINEISDPGFAVESNVPNPFSGNTTIYFSAKINSHIKIEIYDVTGKNIATIFNQDVQKNNYKVEWNASAYPKGIYFAKISSDMGYKTLKMIAQ